MDEHLCVPVRPEPMPGALELVPELAVVVDLAVLDHVNGALFVRDRLVARLEVDDREPPRRERDAGVVELPETVGAAVDQRPAHGGDAFGDGTAVRGRDSADSAHARSVGAA